MNVFRSCSKVLPISRALTARTFASRRAKPKFDWRAGHLRRPAPTIELCEDPWDADAHLESFRSHNLTCTMALHSVELYNTIGSGDIAAIALADAEGVLILHLAAMSKPPSLLSAILGSKKIRKQCVGAGSIQSQIYEEFPKYNIRPDNFFDSRELCLALFPELFNMPHKHLSHQSFLRLAVDTLLGLDYSFATAGQYDYTLSDMRGTPELEYMVNTTWANHLLGLVLQGALEDKAKALLASPGGVVDLVQVMTDCTWTLRDLKKD